VLKNKLYSQEQCARPTVHIPRIPNMVVAWQIICKLKHGQHFTLPVKKCNGTFAMMHPVSATCIASGHVPTELFSDCGLAGNTFTTLLIDDDAGIFTAFDTNANTWELRHDPNFSWRESGGMCDTAKDVVEMQRNNPAAMVHDRPLRWNESYIIFDMNNVHVVFYFPLSLVELGPCIRAMLRISAARKDPECCIGGSTSNKEPILVTIDRRSGRIFEVAKIADLLKVSHIDESDQIVLEPDAQELVDIANAKVSSLLDQPRSTLCETAAIASSQNPCLIS
jgi:hypothetical protein